MGKRAIVLLAVLAALCRLSACVAAGDDPARTSAATTGTGPRPAASRVTKPESRPEDWFVTPSHPAFTAPDVPPPDYTIPPEPAPNFSEPAIS